MPQSEIAAGVQASQVALQHLLGRRGQRLPAQTYVDSQVSQRPEKPVEVTVEREQFVPECAGDLIHPVAAEKPRSVTGTFASPSGSKVPFR